jgi:uncharacterized protein (TIGR03382 family)
MLSPALIAAAFALACATGLLLRRRHRRAAAGTPENNPGTHE